MHIQDRRNFVVQLGWHCLQRRSAITTQRGLSNYHTHQVSKFERFCTDYKPGFSENSLRSCGYVLYGGHVVASLRPRQQKGRFAVVLGVHFGPLIAVRNPLWCWVTVAILWNPGALGRTFICFCFNGTSRKFPMSEYVGLANSTRLGRVFFVLSIPQYPPLRIKNE